MKLKDRIKTFFITLRLSEFGFFWLFIFFAILLLFIDIPRLTPVLILTNAIIFILLGFIVFWGSFRLAKSNILIKGSSNRLESIVANLADGVVAYDNEFRILVFNNAAEHIFKLESTKVIGERFGPERARESKYRLFTQILFPSLAPVVLRRSEEGSYPQIVDISFDDQEFRISTDRIFDSSGQVLGFVKIISDRTRQIELLRSKSEFVSIAAHQLRTPLTAINWTFEGLSKIDSVDPKDKEIIRNGLIATAKLMKIVNDLLDVSKIEEGRFGYTFEEINITNFITEILTNAQVLSVQYGIKLYFEKGKDTSLILNIDPNRLGMALSNIIDNSIKYNVENGSVTVKLEKLQEKPYLQISIKDTGIGIPPEDMPRLFTKFFRSENVVKRETGGSGLGLYIAKNIILRHGGNIWVESVLDRGTTVYITIPTDRSLIPPKEFGFEQ
jgi:two-component system sensor histidine kinase VicK